MTVYTYTPQTYDVEIGRRSVAGDVIQLGYGDYINTGIGIKNDDVEVQGVPGPNGELPHFQSNETVLANGKHIPGPTLPNSWGGAWLDKGICVWKGKRGKISNVEFSGAKSYSFNGAGIRHEGDDLTVTGCYFHDNQNGILGSGTGKYWIQNNRFAKNGYGNGQAHNIYIGKSLEAYFLNNVSEAAIAGHLFKSRAALTVVYGNVFRDGDGSPSYHCDVEGTRCFIAGNTFERTANASNFAAMIHFYIWHYAGQPMELHVKDNRMVAAVDHKGHFLWVDDRIETKDQVTHQTVYLPPVPNSITGSAKGNVCVFTPAMLPNGSPSPVSFGAVPFLIPASFTADPNQTFPLGKEPADTRPVPLTFPMHTIAPEMLAGWAA